MIKIEVRGLGVKLNTIFWLYISICMLQPDEAVRGYAKYFLYHHFFNGTSGKIVLFNLDFFYLSTIIHWVGKGP